MLIRLTMRTLWRSPWFAVACIATIALSIALASTVFAVVDGVLFKPLPYADPDRLVLVFRVIDDPVRREQLRQGTGRAGSLFSTDDLFEWRQADVGLPISAFMINFGIGPVAGAGAMQETTWAARVDRTFFDVLGTRPLAGGFREEHYRQPYQSGKLTAHPALISYRLWRRLQSSGDELPQDLVRVGDGTLQIVGVLPPDFVFPAAFGRTSPDVLLPLDVTPGQRGLQGVARLPQGVSAAAALERLRDVVLEPVNHALGLRERPVFRVTFTAVLAVVLLAALNVAALLAARGRDRAGELALRMALGASPARLFQLVLAEALALAAAGGALGVVAAKPLLNLAITMLPSSFLVIKPPAIDVRVLVFGTVTATLALLVFASWPAMRAARSSAYAGLRQEHGATRSRGAWRRLALIGQSAIGILVVLAGTLLVAGFTALWQEDIGLDRRGTAVVDVTARAVPGPGRQAAMLDDAVRIAARVPGVERISALSGTFLRNAIAGSAFAPPPGSLEVIAQDVPVAAGFFETAGIRLSSGRLPTNDEIEAGRPVAVVSDSLARAFWPGRNPLGQLLSTPAVSVLVIGIVQDVRVVGMEERQRTAEIYIPMRLAAPRADRVLFVRAAGNADVVAKRVAAAITRERPDLMITRAESVDAALAGTVRTRQFQSTLFGAFAVATLVLLGVGMFGAIAMNTASRAREIGVRMALGATASAVRRMVLAENLLPVLIGLVIGGTAAWWTTELLASLIYGVGPHNPRLWALAVMFVISTALFAAWLPAVRASRVDPQVVLRAQ
jgi:putative ABC transport system permease protein